MIIIMTMIIGEDLPADFLPAKEARSIAETLPSVVRNDSKERIELAIGPSGERSQSLIARNEIIFNLILDVVYYRRQLE